MHIFNNRRRFINFREASKGDHVIAGDGRLPIRGYGEVDIKVKNLAGKEETMRLRDVAYCREMPTNLVSLIRFLDSDIHWDTRPIESGQTILKTKCGRVWES